MSRILLTKVELQDRVTTLGQLLFEAVHLLRTEETEDEDRMELVEQFLYKCQKEGMV